MVMYRYMADTEISGGIAAESASVTAEVYDINHFPHLREKYNVMSVPCLVINDDKVTFGKKNIRQLLDILK